MPKPEPDVEFPIVGVIYRVTVESPDHRTYEFTSWDSYNPYAAAHRLYSELSSDCARVTEQFVRRSEQRTVFTRGYGGGDNAPGTTPERENALPEEGQ